MKTALCNLFCLLAFLALSKNGVAQAITTGFVAGHITTCQGAESQNQEVQYFTVSGSGLTGGVTITASPGFLVSTTENKNFASQLTLPELSFDTLYVRISATADTGVNNGAITLSSPGAETQYVAVKGKVLQNPVAAAEPNITVLNGTTIPRLYFEGLHANTFLWTSSNPDIGLPSTGIDSLPTFRALIPGNESLTTTITVTPVWAGMTYVRDQAASVIRVINDITNTLDTSVTSAGTNSLSSVLSEDACRLFVVNKGGNNFGVINTLTNRLRSAFTLPGYGVEGGQTATALNDSLIYVLTGAVFTISAITGHSYGYVFPDAAYPSALAVNPNGQEVYLTAMASAGQGVINFIATPSGHENGKVTVPAFSSGLVLTPDTTRMACISVFTGNAISVVDVATRKVIKSIFPSIAPTALAVSPDSKTLYSLTGYLLQAYDLSTFATKWLAGLSGTPTGLSVSPDGTRIYVSGSGPGMVSVVNALTGSVVTTVPLFNTANIDLNTVTPGGCYGEPITFTITVNPAPLPALSEEGALDELTTVYGTASAGESFTVSGSTLRGGVLVTPPAGFEVSLDGVSFSSTVTIADQGSLDNAVVYIRIAATSIVATYTGHVVLTSPGAANVTIAIPDSKVTPAALTITANNQTKAYGAPNPPLTLTYTGFVNSDGPAQLVYPPVASTTAERNSPPGSYPITVSDAYSSNYDISYAPGVLTVTPNVVIPNVFTPNGDGINDTWDIHNINNYADCTVQVFNRAGQLVYSSTGYSIPWDGTYKGSPLAAGTYYYIINLNANVPLLSGYVTIIR